MIDRSDFRRRVYFANFPGSVSAGTCVFIFLSLGSTEPMVLRWPSYSTVAAPSPASCRNPFASGIELVGRMLLLAGLTCPDLQRCRWSSSWPWRSFQPNGVQVDSETLLGFEEVSYFVMFAWLGIAGPGPVSLDHFVLSTFRPNPPASDYRA